MILQVDQHRSRRSCKMAPSRPTNGDENAGLKPDSQSHSVSRRVFGKQMIIVIIILVLGAWICAVWIFSSAFKQPERASNLRILVADLDGGQVGEYFTGASNRSQINLNNIVRWISIGRMRFVFWEIRNSVICGCRGFHNHI